MLIYKTISLAILSLFWPILSKYQLCCLLWCFSHSHHFIFLLRQLYSSKTIVWLIGLCPTSGSIAVAATLAAMYPPPLPQSMFVWGQDLLTAALGWGLILQRAIDQKAAAMMNFAPPANECSGGTLSPTPGAVPQIGSPRHSTLLLALSHCSS